MQRRAEQRNALRIPLSVQVLCQIELTSVSGECHNLSESGMFVSVQGGFPVGSIVALRFQLPPRPTGPVIQAQGVVVRAKQGEFMGIEFLHLEASYRGAIAQFIARFLEGSRPAVNR